MERLVDRDILSLARTHGYAHRSPNHLEEEAEERKDGYGIVLASTVQVLQLYTGITTTPGKPAHTDQISRIQATWQ